MTLVCISDTHNQYQPEIPDGDVLIHSGDFTSGTNSLKDLLALEKWFKTLPHEHKILVPGNHDFIFEDFPNDARSLIPSATVLINESLIIKGATFYGTPDQPYFYNWAFNRTSKQLVESYSKIPLSTNVLITHTPPFKVLDKVLEGKYVGSKELLDVVHKVSPEVHIFGHIHESYGIEKINNTTFINASICNRRYNPVHKPIIYNLKDTI